MKCLSCTLLFGNEYIIVFHSQVSPTYGGTGLS